jgi:hypothetical protein
VTAKVRARARARMARGRDISSMMSKRPIRTSSRSTESPPFCI